jgi:hypothetical protein
MKLMQLALLVLTTTTIACIIPMGGDGIGGCFEHFTCDSSDMCIDSDCESAYGREWVITIEGGSLPERNPDGGSWDIAGGAPDAFVVIELDGETCITSTQDDTLFPTWNEECRFTIDSDSTWIISIVDEDFAEHDLIHATTEATIPISMLRQGEKEISVAGMDPWLTLSLRPR